MSNTKFLASVACIMIQIVLLFFHSACALPSAVGSSPDRGFVSLKPATHWEQALVSGNGKYGALVFGQPTDETIILNHSRLYMPVHEPIAPVNTGVHLEEIRQMIADGQYRKAAEWVDEIAKGQGYVEKRWTDPFIPAFNILIKMEQKGEIKDYFRSLDFSTGITTVNWSDQEDTYQRRLFVSRADDAVVLQIIGLKKGSVDCLLKLAQQPPKGTGGWSPEKMHREGIKSYSTGAEQNWLTYRSDFTKQWEGSLKGFEGVSRVVFIGGKAVKDGDSIRISHADEVLVLTKIGLLYTSQKSILDKLKAELLKMNPDFQVLADSHARIHGSIFNRTKLDLGGGSDRMLSSEELLARSRIGSLNAALLEKEFDAARYNILSASGELFPNLQGIWSGTYGPYWSGDFTLNGNVQSAISANLSANMAECLLPFFNYMEYHIGEFRENAKMLFGCRGIHVPSRASNHCLKNCFEAERPMTFWTAGAAWVSQFYFDYFLYTGDKKFLKERAFPFMKEAALFYEDFLKPGPDGKLLFSPGLSPENSPANTGSQACFNAAMDIGAAQELLRNCIRAGKLLGGEDGNISRWEAMLSQIPGYLVNEKGALKEWATPLLEENDLHRHASHLYALFNGMPGEIAADTNLVEAFRKALHNRLEIRRREFLSPVLRELTEKEIASIPNYTPSGDNGEIIEGRPPGEMAFGIVQQGFAAASLHESETCATILDWLANCYWFPNMMTTHNPKAIFNTDLSGGLPALILRMLVDSQPGWIELLPAWHAGLPQGKVTGVALRGQVIAKEISWQGKRVTTVLHSPVQQRIMIKTPHQVSSISSGNEPLKPLNGNYFLLLPANTDVTVQLDLM